MANMFGALNRFISRLDSDPNVSLQQQAPQQQSPGSQSNSHAATTGYGFQVLRNTNPSLALEPWFDFIVGINGRTLDSSDPHLFATEVRNCAGSALSIGVFSAKGQAIREQYINIPADAGSLGLSLQWSPLAASTAVWHILDVMPNSPADAAGLLPYSDYIVGSPDSASLRGEASLGELVERYTGRPLRLHVYNAEYDVVRLLTLSPAKGWGGEGALGCVLGFGALHRVPAPLGEPTEAPGETLFESAAGANTTALNSSQSPPPPTSSGSGAGAGAPPGEFLVPAEMSLTTAPPPPPASSKSPGPPPGSLGRPKKARAHHAAGAAAGGGLDDYFAEGEQKSREIDRVPTPKAGVAGGSLPPPPKAGEKVAAPPKASSPSDGEGEGEG